MRLLVVSNMYPSPERPVGGIFVHEQVKALRATGIEVRVASGRPLWLPAKNTRWAVGLVRREVAARRKPFAWREFEGVPVLDFAYFAGAFARPWLYPWIYRQALAVRLPQIVSEFPYDLVHTHTAFLDGRAGATAAAARSVPMVLTEHTGPFSLVTRHPAFRVHTLAGLKAAARVVAVSAALRDEIRRQLPTLVRHPIDVIPNGVDTTFFDPDLPDSLLTNSGESGWAADLSEAKRELVLSSFLVGLREALLMHGEARLSGVELARIVETAVTTGVGRGPFQQALREAGLPTQAVIPEDVETVTVLWVGHLVSVKRVDRLLDAFAIAFRRRPRLRLRLVGGGELEAPLRAQAAALGIEKAVLFLPGKDRAGVRAEMRDADFLVLSSETETFGVVGIEAQAMGLPVLATDCGGPAEYVTGSALGERVGLSAEDLAIGLQRMVDRLGEFDGKAIRKHVVERFDFAQIAERLVRLYEDVLTRRPVAAS